LAIDGVCVVVSPLISLMKDQVENLNKRNIPARAIYSGMNDQEIRFTLNQFLYGHAKFLYVSPERLQSEAFIEYFKAFKLGLLAIDEAHCISQWGYDFRPPYTQIAKIREYHPQVPVLALTATATPQVVLDICQKLNFKENNIFQKSFRRSNLIYSIVNTEDKVKQMIDYFKMSKGTAVVYVRNRKKTESIADVLRKNEISADYYHAGLDNKAREKKQLDWINNKTRVMVATNAFGMGIDKPDVRLVIHLDIPESPEAYFQEAGRGGRDEKKANAILLNSVQDVLNLQKTLDDSFPDEQVVRHTYRSLANYFKLAHYTGEGRSFEIDLLPFFFTYQIIPKKGFNAIKILEKSELISMIDADAEPPRIHINFQKKELYDYIVNYPNDENLIQTLLRSYPGLFTNYVTIDEGTIASRLGVKEKDVMKQLEILHKRKVLMYIPRNKLPKVHFLQNMQNPDTIQVYTPKVMFLKKQATDRATAMINYVNSTDKCRS
jgi:ATP-dependent DNA helicase RecQ